MCAKRNFICEFPHKLQKLQNSIREFWGNDINGWRIILVSSLPSEKKKKIGTSCQKLYKNRYQCFLFLSNFELFLCFIPNILSKILYAYSYTCCFYLLVFWNGNNGNEIKSKLLCLWDPSFLFKVIYAVEKVLFC